LRPFRGFATADSIWHFHIPLGYLVLRHIYQNMIAAICGVFSNYSKTLLESDYPAPKVVALRLIRGCATAVFIQHFNALYRQLVLRHGHRTMTTGIGDGSSSCTKLSTAICMMQVLHSSTRVAAPLSYLRLNENASTYCKDVLSVLYLHCFFRYDRRTPVQLDACPRE
jgi:hypothetical protein